MSNHDAAAPAALDEAADARRVAVLARAKEILDRQPTFEEMVDQETRRERNRQAAVNARIDAAIAASRAQREEIEQPVDKPAGKWVRTAVDVTLERAEELCRKAWDAPYVRGGCGDGPAIKGNCVNKALWLQERLGGVVVGGWRAGGSPHAVLLFASEGELFVADDGRVTAVGHYEFHFDAFYHRAV